MEEQLANSADPTSIQESIDEIKAIRESIITTKADLESTVADETEPTDPEQPA